MRKKGKSGIGTKANSIPSRRYLIFPTINKYVRVFFRMLLTKEQKQERMCINQDIVSEILQ